MKTTAADHWFSMCVRERANWTCERCGREYPYPTNGGLHCAHYETRDNWATRFEPLNAFALCHGCHQYFDKGRRFEFDAFYVAKFGAEARDIVKEKALQHATLAKQAKHEGKEMSAHFRKEYMRLRGMRVLGRQGRVEFVGYP